MPADGVAGGGADLVPDDSTVNMIHRAYDEPRGAQTQMCGLTDLLIKHDGNVVSSGTNLVWNPEANANIYFRLLDVLAGRFPRLRPLLGALRKSFGSIHQWFWKEERDADQLSANVLVSLPTPPHRAGLLFGKISSSAAIQHGHMMRVDVRL